MSGYKLTMRGRTSLLALTPLPEASLCPIPLLGTTGNPANGRAGGPGGGSQIDPKMVVAPPAPVYPKR